MPNEEDYAEGEKEDYEKDLEEISSRDQCNRFFFVCKKLKFLKEVRYRYRDLYIHILSSHHVNLFKKLPVVTVTNMDFENNRNFRF
jgi:hypothetical protein